MQAFDIMDPLLSCADIVRWNCIMARVVIFFEGEVIALVFPLLDRAVKDLITINLLGHLSIAVPSVIEIQRWDEIVFNSSPSMESLLILFFRPSATVLDVLWCVSFTLFSDNKELAFRAPSKVTLVSEEYVLPVLWIWSFFKQSLGPEYSFPGYRLRKLIFLDGDMFLRASSFHLVADSYLFVITH